LRQKPGGAQLMKPIKHCRIGTLSLAACAFLALPAVALAQVAEPMGTYVPPRNHHMRADDDAQGQDDQSAQQPSMQRQQQPAAQAQPQPLAPPSAVPPSMLDKPAQPAKVDLAQGHLAIHADNSSLIEIMHQLTAAGGMTVDGLNKDQRIFGTYGPGDPQEVISDLLDGSGYNVVMLGRTDAGTPKQVTLTLRVGGLSNSSGAMRPQPMNQQDDDADEEPQQQPIIAPPPENQIQQQAPQQPGGGVRTPQQMLQELQQMRQQQMQQQQGQPQPTPPQQP
jgi:hypothetical protein